MSGRGLSRSPSPGAGTDSDEQPGGGNNGSFHSINSKTTKSKRSKRSKRRRRAKSPGGSPSGRSPARVAFSPSREPEATHGSSAENIYDASLSGAKDMNNVEDMYASTASRSGGAFRPVSMLWDRHQNYEPGKVPEKGGLFDIRMINHSSGFWSYLWQLPRHLRRASSNNLSERLVSVQEEDYLQAVGHNSELVKNFLAFRRSCLVAMFIPFAVSVIVGLIDIIQKRYDLERLCDENPILYELFGESEENFILFSAINLTVTTIAWMIATLSLRSWADYDRSKRLVAWSWSAYFLTPFALSLFPFRYFVEVPEASPGVVDNTLYFFSGAYLGLRFFAILGPSAISLFPALIRSALRTRSLTPQSPIPGALCSSIPLFVGPLMWTSFVSTYQLLGSSRLLAAMVIYTLAPFIFVVARTYITVPMTAKQAVKYATRLRNLYSLCFLIAGGLALSSIERTELGDQIIESLFSIISITKYTADFLGKLFFTNVFAGDLLVSLMATLRAVEVDLKTKRNRNLVAEHVRRCEELRQLVDGVEQTDKALSRSTDRF